MDYYDSLVKFADTFGNDIVLLTIVLVVLSLPDAILKPIAMWKAAKNNSINWFISLFVFNTIGILPLFYICWFNRDDDDF